MYPVFGGFQQRQSTSAAHAQRARSSRGRDFVDKKFVPSFFKKWFRNLYLKHGEAFAAFIKNKPMLKNVIRRWMDSRIANMEVA
jgi:hypothetical protein